MSNTRMWTLEPMTFVAPSMRAIYGADTPRLPSPVYLIEHDDGLVIFDAGVNPEYAGDPTAGYGAMAEHIDMDFQQHHTIEAQLGDLGFSLTDVKHVVASHLHFDHAGGLRQFGHATTYIGAGEADYARDPEKFCTGWFLADDFDDRHGLQWREVTTDHDIFGDGRVRILTLPGHTPGSLGLQVQLDHSHWILTGDAVHTRGGFEAEMHYHGDHDSVTARRTLRKIRRLQQESNAEVWICHDPEDWAAFEGAGLKT